MLLHFTSQEKGPDITLTLMKTTSFRKLRFVHYSLDTEDLAAVAQLREAEKPDLKGVPEKIILAARYEATEVPRTLVTDRYGNPLFDVEKLTKDALPGIADRAVKEAADLEGKIDAAMEMAEECIDMGRPKRARRYLRLVVRYRGYPAVAEAKQLLEEMES